MEMENAPAHPRAVDWYVALTFALGALAFTGSFFLEPIDEPGALVLVLVLASFSEWLSLRLQQEGRVSLGIVALVLGVLSFGLPGGALVVASITLVGWVFFSRPEPRRLFFNFGQQNIAIFIPGLVMTFVDPSFVAGHPAYVLVAGAAAGTAIFVGTSVAVGVVLSLSSGDSFRAVWRRNFVWLFPHHAALGAIGAGLAVTYERFGIIGIVLPVFPLILSRYSMKQVLDSTRANLRTVEESNTRLQVANVEIRRMSDELRASYTGTLESLVAALDVRDQETKGHSVRVASHSYEIAQLIGIKDEEDLGTIYRGALMHDVGKIGVSDNILLKPGALTEEEWVFMRKHPAMGYRILAQVPYLRPTAMIVLAHHERWDGDGYPRKLKAENIPLGSRIFAIADTYDAIISDRPYRKGKSPEAALEEILRCSGDQFDPRIVEAFEALFPRWRDENTQKKPRPLYLPHYNAHDQDLTKTG